MAVEPVLGRMTFDVRLRSSSTIRAAERVRVTRLLEPHLI
jgi:hypothetical protein